MSGPIHGLPQEQRSALRRARQLEWWTVVHVLLTAVALYVTMGGSQAMKSAFLDDLIGIVPAGAYLLAARYAWRSPTSRFPYGFHRALSIAFFLAALSIVALGLFIVIDSGMKLIKTEHPTIGTVELFGDTIWLGWFMLAALTFNAVPRIFLGRAKLPLADKLNDKILHSEAVMNRADWLAAGAAMVGVVGIGFGLWWFDAVAALLIGVEIIEEGGKQLRGVAFHLMGETPTSIDYKKTVELPSRIEDRVRSIDWVADARARLREEGRMYFGEVFVVPRNGEVTPQQIVDAERRIHEVDWRVEDVVVTVVPGFAENPHLKGLQD